MSCLKRRPLVGSTAVRVSNPRFSQVSYEPSAQNRAVAVDDPPRKTPNIPSPKLVVVVPIRSKPNHFLFQAQTFVHDRYLPGEEEEEEGGIGGRDVAG